MATSESTPTMPTTTTDWISVITDPSTTTDQAISTDESDVGDSASVEEGRIDGGRA